MLLRRKEVVEQLQTAIEEESNTLLSQIEFVQKTLESMYTSSHGQKAAKATKAKRNGENLQRQPEPTIAELKELSGWLEQRYRLEDIFRKASHGSRGATKKIMPLRGDTQLRSENTTNSFGVQPLSRPPFNYRKATSSSLEFSQKQVLESATAAPLIQKKNRKKNTLRSRIRDAQDAQYLM